MCPNTGPAPGRKSLIRSTGFRTECSLPGKARWFCFSSLARPPKLTAVKVLDVIGRSSEYLTRKGVDSPRLQVELILAQVLQLPRLKLYLNFDRVLNPAELDQIRAMVSRRGDREPLQHILGSACFCGLEFAVNRKVLIPRPETELLAEKAWTLLATLQESGGPVAVADVGTGSGCLAITLATKCPEAKLDGLDISTDALEVAAGNAARLAVAERIHFYQSDLFEGIPPERRFDLVVTNPPYIPTQDIPRLQAEVRDWDPSLALDGGRDGLAFYRRLAAKAPSHLKTGGVLMAEFGDDQAEDVRRCFEQQQWAIDDFVKDLAGKPRIIIARRPVP